MWGKLAATASKDKEESEAASMLFEVLDDECPAELTELMPEDGHITYVALKGPLGTLTRENVMHDSIDLMLGTYEISEQLGKLPRYPYLVQIVRVDDIQVSFCDFAGIFTRTNAAAKEGLAPRILDAWMCRGNNGIALGFIVMEKPDFTMAEYFEQPSDEEREPVLRSRVMVAAPLARSLLERIAKNSGSELGCWPGPMLSPHGIGLYAMNKSTPVRAVVTDWSCCISNTVPPERILHAFMQIFRGYLDTVVIPPITTQQYSLSDKQAVYKRAISSDAV